MKQLIATIFAGALAFGSVSAFSADSTTTDQMKKDETTAPKAAAKTKRKASETKEYAGEKTDSVKAKTKRVAKKAKAKIAQRKTTDPASPSETKPDMRK
jgi:hypothetical protein